MLLHNTGKKEYLKGATKEVNDRKPTVDNFWQAHRVSPGCDQQEQLRNFN